MEGEGVARATVARGLWRLFDLVVLPVILVVSMFALLARWETAREARPPRLPGRAPVYHQVKQGEDLRGLSAKYYGDPRHWPEIFHANRARLTGRALTPGERLVIPPPPRSR